MFLLLFFIISSPFCLGVLIDNNVCRSIEDTDDSLLVIGELSSSLFLLTKALLVATPPKSILTLNDNRTNIDLRSVEFQPIERFSEMFQELQEFQKCRHRIVSARIESEVFNKSELLILEPDPMFAYRLTYDFHRNELSARTRFTKEVSRMANETILSQHGGGKLTKFERAPDRLIWKEIQRTHNGTARMEEFFLKETTCPGGNQTCDDYRTGFVYNNRAVIFNSQNVSIYRPREDPFPVVRSLRSILYCPVENSTGKSFTSLLPVIYLSLIQFFPLNS